MSDTSPRNQSALLHGAGPPPAREPRPGERLWSITKKDGARLDCEIRDHGAAGAEVQMLRDGQFLYGRRWATRLAAELDADEERQRHLRDGGVLIGEGVA